MTIQDRIDTLREELTALEAELNKPTVTAAKPVTQPGWPMVVGPERDTDYLYVTDDGKADFSFWNMDGIDAGRLAIGNCYATRADAEASARRARATQLLRKTIAEVTAEMAPGWVPDWSDDEQEKCCLNYRHESGRWIVMVTYGAQFPNTPYFASVCGPKIIRRMGDNLEDLL